MENSTSSSNGELSERGATKTEKTHQKITLLTFEFTEMTRTVRDNDPKKMDINQIYSLVKLHFIPERIKFHSRADFFGISREK